MTRYDVYKVKKSQVNLCFNQNEYLVSGVFDSDLDFVSLLLTYNCLPSSSSTHRSVCCLSLFLSICVSVCQAHLSNISVFVKVETSSDSYLVVSGLPERNGNKHAGEIASMSLRLVTYLKEFKISHMQERTLQFRIGIHTGKCGDFN